jgi:hypothetical protein
MTRNAFICLLSLFLVQAAHADSLKDELNHTYKKHILALRYPFTTGDLKFVSAGHPMNVAPNSGWLLYAGIYVEKLNLSADTVRVQGPIAAFADEKIDGNQVLVRFSKPQQIEIHLDQPLKSFADAQAVLGRVFFLGIDAPEHVKPELRRADDTTPDDQIYDYHLEGIAVPNPYSRPNPNFPRKLVKKNFRAN